MVFLIDKIVKKNGHLVLITPTGKRFQTNGRLTIKHADPARLGHDSVDVPLYKRHRDQIVCETDEAGQRLMQMLARIAADENKLDDLPDEIRGEVFLALNPQKSPTNRRFSRRRL